MDSNVEQRKKCSSKSGGLSLFGISAKTSSTDCSTFDAASDNWESTAVKRMESKTYGSLPSGVDISFLYRCFSKMSCIPYVQIFQSSMLIRVITSDIEYYFKIWQSKLDKILHPDKDLKKDNPSRSSKTRSAWEVARIGSVQPA